MRTTVVPVVDEGLGNSAYLVDLGDGRALAVDASRDLRSLRIVAQRRGLQIAFAADTHLHADFLSGAVQLSADDGATVLASRAGGREFPHRGLADGDEVGLGGLHLRTMATPGHTHEHIAFELLDDQRVLGVFTGGSLIVDSTARTDLVAPERTEELAQAQYHSLRRLAALDDAVEIWPTHGAGSFCSAPPGSERTSTIGIERATNPLLRAASEDAFVKQLLASLGSYPPYFLELEEVNRRGPQLMTGDPLPGLTVADVLQLRRWRAEIVDVRPVADFAAAHVPGSISIPLRPVFATWLGWLLPTTVPLVMVRNADQDPDEVLWQARKIGRDHLLGVLDGGIEAWTRAGQPTGSIPLVEAGHVGDTSVLDIRQEREFVEGHVPGATHLELGNLAEHPDSLTAGAAGPTVVMCGHGERAMSAASLLARTSHSDLSVLVGGPNDWAAATNRSLEEGS